MVKQEIYIMKIAKLSNLHCKQLNLYKGLNLLPRSNISDQNNNFPVILNDCEILHQCQQFINAWISAYFSIKANY